MTAVRRAQAMALLSNRVFLVDRYHQPRMVLASPYAKSGMVLAGTYTKSGMVLAIRSAKSSTGLSKVQYWRRHLICKVRY
eukprot:121551-Rhodomonas_salina.1